MDRPLFYGRDGQPLSMDEWARLFHDRAYKIVQQDQAGDVQVSTVWIGIDARLLGDGEPLIFETMIFGGPRGYQRWQWSTEAEALAGHAEITSGVLR